jgi:hypothetical protein
MRRRIERYASEEGRGEEIKIGWKIKNDKEEGKYYED